MLVSTPTCFSFLLPHYLPQFCLCAQTLINHSQLFWCKFPLRIVQKWEGSKLIFADNLVFSHLRVFERQLSGLSENGCMSTDREKVRLRQHKTHQLDLQPQSKPLDRKHNSLYFTLSLSFNLWLKRCTWKTICSCCPYTLSNSKKRLKIFIFIFSVLISIGKLLWTAVILKGLPGVHL